MPGDVATELLAPVYRRIDAFAAENDPEAYVAGLFGEDFHVLVADFADPDQGVVVLRHRDTGAWLTFPVRTPAFRPGHDTFTVRWDALAPGHRQMLIETGLAQATVAETAEALLWILADQGPNSRRAAAEAAAVLSLEDPALEPLKVLVALGEFHHLQERIAEHRALRAHHDFWRQIRTGLHRRLLTQHPGWTPDQRHSRLQRWANDAEEHARQVLGADATATHPQYRTVVTRFLDDLTDHDPVEQ